MHIPNIPIPKTSSKNLEEMLAVSEATVTPGKRRRLIKQASKKSFGILAGQTDRKTLTMLCDTVNAVCKTHYNPAELSYINARFQVISGFYCTLFGGGLKALNYLVLHNSSAVTGAEKLSIGLGITYAAVGTFRQHYIKRTGKAMGSPTALESGIAFLIRESGFLGYLSEVAIKLKVKADKRGEKSYHRKEQIRQAAQRTRQLIYGVGGGIARYARKFGNYL